MSYVNHLKRVSGKNVEDFLIGRYGESFAEYRRLWHQAEHSRKALDFPIHIDFELNDVCNQKCVMCPRNDATLARNWGMTVNTGKRMSFETFRRVIDEAASLGTKSINVGGFSEPFIHSELVRMLTYAHSKGILDSICISNGVLMDETTARGILESGLTRLYISLDAYTDDTYRKIRGSGFEKAKANLLRFLELRNKKSSEPLPWVRVSFVVMNENVHEKDDFIRFWSGKVDHVDIQKYMTPTLSMDPKILKKQKQFECFEPWRRLAVRANGKILPCCVFRGELLDLGNIQETSLEMVWKSEKLEKIRSAILKDSLGVCAICQRI
jgi:radical SAM protein with 4Fe4S-binding SPASM domain